MPGILPDPQQAQRLKSIIGGYTDNDVVERLGMLPFGKYSDGKVRMAWPEVAATAGRAIWDLGDAASVAARNNDPETTAAMARQSFDAASAAPLGGVAVGLAGAVPEGAVAANGIGRSKIPDHLRTLSSKDRIATPDQSVLDKAVEYFGVTRDPAEAGYILPDGRILDFSKRKSDPRFHKPSQRVADHRELGDLAENNEVGMREFMGNSHAMRFMPETGYIAAVAQPSDQQITAALRARQRLGITEPMRIEFYNGTKTGSDDTRVLMQTPHIELERPTLAAIKDFFAKNPRTTDTLFANSPTGASVPLAVNAMDRRIAGGTMPMGPTPETARWLVERHGSPEAALKHLADENAGIPAWMPGAKEMIEGGDKLSEIIRSGAYSNHPMGSAAPLAFNDYDETPKRRTRGMIY